VPLRQRAHAWPGTRLREHAAPAASQLPPCVAALTVLASVLLAAADADRCLLWQVQRQLVPVLHCAELLQKDLGPSQWLAVTSWADVIAAQCNMRTARVAKSQGVWRVMGPCCKRVAVLELPKEHNDVQLLRLQGRRGVVVRVVYWRAHLARKLEDLCRGCCCCSSIRCCFVMQIDAGTCEHVRDASANISCKRNQKAG
jgi:hypothetical protein